MCNSSDISVTDFLVSEEFILYVTDPAASNSKAWEAYFRQNPTHIEIAQQAKQIINCELEFHPLPDFEIKELELRIFEKCGLSALN